MPKPTAAERVALFQDALQALIDRVAEDRYVLAVVNVGSLSEETIWSREWLHVWIIEADGVTRRLKSDGQNEDISRILIENGVNIYVDLIARSRFKAMVEGTSRTAFSCNFFAERELVYSADPSIKNWFKTANTIAVKDQEKELLTFSTWTIHAVLHARKRLLDKGDIELAKQHTLEAAHSIAHTEIIREGKVREQDIIYRAIELNPNLFQTIYLDVLAKRKSKKLLLTALDAIDGYVESHYRQHLKPLLKYLQGQQRVVPLSEMSEHFAYTQIHPWHLASACDWLEEKGLLDKLSAPFKLTKRSRERVEEPAYLLDP